MEIYLGDKLSHFFVVGWGGGGGVRAPLANSG